MITTIDVKQHGISDVFTFRAVDLERDEEVLYEWMQQDHIAPFWKLNVEKPLFKKWLHNSVTSEKKDVYIGTYHGAPACYLIAYDVQGDEIANYYPYEAGDLGMHLLIGPRAYLNKEDGLSLIRAMILFLFHHYGAKRIIGEPDVRNRLVIPILKKIGGEVQGRITLPHKKASLLIGEREAVFEQVVQNGITVSVRGGTSL
ncbi:IucA/IucC protein [Fictibacillus macauensis ZFHKF-1]|uniref:Lysine N-acyltransferase MbtK n=1 Tax=Fictibacillus macauensis ZFHKF-1 TaxID=1196324 RepID=I8AFS1_9BACL|nr:GNAT family N-acetyltransferase [Fictibacillus macauensis]EIT84229.1 IucA/IucC protein [Fictibacillus macauensis ZFHKF-1]